MSVSRPVRKTASGVVGAVAVQRLAEVAWSRRNENRLRARGAVEHGAGHHRTMVAVHTGWLASTAIEASIAQSSPRTRIGALCVYAALQPLRYWVIRTLGDRWTTRILVLPDEGVVTDGPFRRFRHPNYMIVAAELALLPYALGARRTAVAFTVLNAALMAVRIPAEEAALRPTR